MLKQNKFELVTEVPTSNKRSHLASNQISSQFSRRYHSKRSNLKTTCFSHKSSANQNSSQYLCKERKRKSSEAFKQSLHSLLSKRTCTSSRFLEDTNLFSHTKTLFERIFERTKLSSANNNENNDNFSKPSPLPIHISDESSFEELPFSSSNFHKNPCLTNNRLTIDNLKPETFPHTSFTTADPLLSKNFDSEYSSQYALDNSCKKVDSINNKRRYCNHHAFQSESVKSANNKVLRTLFRLEEEKEILNSPPSRIPRSFHRSQSAFCQARKAAEVQKFSQLASPCLRRYNSWTNAPKTNFCLGYEKTIPSAFKKSHFSSTRDPFLEFNSNANATPSNKSSSEIDFNFFSNLSSSNKSSNTDFSIVSDQNPGQFDKCSKTFEPGFTEEHDSSEVVVEITPKPLPASQQFSGNLFHDLVKESVDWLQGEKDIENLAKLKVDTSKTLACSCKKEKSDIESSFQKRSAVCKNTLERSGFDQRVATCIHCFCRKSTEKKAHSVERSAVRFPLLSKAVTASESSTETTYRKSTASSRISRGDFSEILSSLFSEKRSLYNNNFENSHCTQGRKNKLFGSFSEIFCSSRNKQLLQSSSNNHNIREEVYFSAVDNSKLDSAKALNLVRESSQLPSTLKSSFIPEHLFSQKDQQTFRKHSSSFCYSRNVSDMGCIHSVSQKKRVEPCRSSIFSDVRATIDQSPTIIEEYSPIVLRYRTPYFRAHAQVIMPPIRDKETWTVGWIQACDYMKFINQYGDLGYSSWEIPALKANKIPAVSDSDGVSYPWYGNTTEIATIVGPTDSYTRMNLTMNDNFYPSVTWDIPVSEGTNAHLTEIVRDQSFITWLAAINETTKEIIILKTVRWSFYLEIHVDPTRELGQRARVVTPTIQNQPSITNGIYEKHQVGVASKMRRRVTSNNSNSNCLNHIPISALVRPSANNAQTLIWRPANSDPIIVVPAKEEHRDTNELVLFNGCSAMHGKEAIMKEISKQELIQLQQLNR